MAGTPDLFVVCKKCGSEVSPYITECPYCGQRLRKRAPKLRQEIAELVPKRRRLTLRRKRRADAQPLSWLKVERPYGTIVLILAPGVLYLLVGATTLTLNDLGAISGPLDGDWWRLGAARWLDPNATGMLLLLTIRT